ncbi:Uncharacterized protein ToN1_43320 [Aromatoleum petrolei]|nr:Uncharacterized protein ToN1_43320 [Aromatoleum petrolei]
MGRHACPISISILSTIYRCFFRHASKIHRLPPTQTKQIGLAHKEASSSNVDSIVRKCRQAAGFSCRCIRANRRIRDSARLCGPLRRRTTGWKK